MKIGDGCKLQNGVYIYSGVEIDQDVFIGPNATFTNDILPRAFINNWEVIKTKIRKGSKYRCKCHNSMWDYFRRILYGLQIKGV